MMLLPLPREGSTDAKAPVAVMVSGEGVRQGLLRGPKPLVIAPDGRILVLESLSQRIFDDSIMTGAIGSPAFSGRARSNGVPVAGPCSWRRPQRRRSYGSAVRLQQLPLPPAETLKADLLSFGNRQDISCQTALPQAQRIFDHCAAE
jgi:hypothetical protein